VLPRSTEYEQLHSTRREFLKKAAVASAGAALSIPAVSYGRIIGANDQINLGIIGMGRQARGLMHDFNTEPGAGVVAVAEVYEPNAGWAKQASPEIEVYADLRRLLDRDDIDAVIVATPDHWHAAATVMAADAGKDVYVEKPTARSIKESRAMVEAARRNERIIQVGTQQRSQRHFQEAVEFIRAGGLGEVSFARTWNYGNEFPNGIGIASESDPPPGLDWEMWLGPAPRVPFSANRFGVLLDDDLRFQRWSTWRYFWDYGGGFMTDWGTHLLDIVQWAMDVEYPEVVTAVGGKFYVQDDRDTPDTLTATYRYPTFIATYENRALNNHQLEGRGYGIMFHGTKATLVIDRQGYEVIPQPNSDVVAVRNEQNDAPVSHPRHFLDAMRSRSLPNNDIEIGHRSTSAAILGNIAYRTGRAIHWDGAGEAIVNDPEAEAYLSVEYRGPWSL